MGGYLREQEVLPESLRAGKRFGDEGGGGCRSRKTFRRTEKKQEHKGKEEEKRIGGALEGFLSMIDDLERKRTGVVVWDM